jgi:tetratricopeptide (TPR) repeat protein
MKDPRGNPVGTSSQQAVDAAENALWRLMSFFDTPFADLDAAIDADPGWALPRVMRAGFLLSLTEPGLVVEARALLDEAEPLLGGASEAERIHFHAVQLLADGRWHEACRSWDALLLQHPRDALALQWAQLWDFHRGDAPQLRARPARALPAWDEADPLHPYVLALYAFGLEENHLYPQAEEVGRRALAGGAKVPWAVHAVAHVMEMQGRFDEGAAWLRQQQEGWAEGNGFSAHLWWHLGLFRLEAMDLAGAQRLADARLAGEALQVTLQRLDAASLLWRLHLLGVDVASRAQALADGWLMDTDAAGHSAFNDTHALLAMLAAGDVPRADAWLASVAAHALRNEDARRAAPQTAREAGLPLMRGLVAHARGQFDVAAEALYAVRPLAQRLGGSHAQRDLIDQTLLAAAAAGGRRDLGRALLHERSMAKPATPLTRHWAERLGVELR